MPPASPPPPHPRHRLWRGLLIAGLGSLMAGVALLVLVVAWYGPQLPSLDPVTTYQPRQPLQVFTADGVEIGQFGTERRQFTPIAQHIDNHARLRLRGDCRWAGIILCKLVSQPALRVAGRRRITFAAKAVPVEGYRRIAHRLLPRRLNLSCLNATSRLLCHAANCI